MRKYSFTVTDSKSRKIRGYYIKSATPAKNTVMIIHGILEHKDRMHELTEFLVEHGSNVICFDLPGFGESDGARCYIENFDDYDEAILRVYERFKKIISGLPFFVAGNSMGGLLSIFFAAKTPALAGLILIAPLVDLPFPERRAFKLISRLLYTVSPAIYLQSLIVQSRLTSERMEAYQYNQDPLKGRVISAGFSHAMFQRIPVYKVLPTFPNLPVLIFSAAEDKIVNSFATAKFLNRLPHPDKTLYSFATYGHDLLHDNKRTVIFNLLTGWLNKRS